jgi:hypothetical protein
LNDVAFAFAIDTRFEDRLLYSSITSEQKTTV